MRRLQHIPAVIALQMCSIETQLVHCCSSFHHKAYENGRHNEPIPASGARFRDSPVLAHVVLGKGDARGICEPRARGGVFRRGRTPRSPHFAPGARSWPGVSSRGEMREFSRHPPGPVLRAHAGGPLSYSWSFFPPPALVCAAIGRVSAHLLVRVRAVSLAAPLPRLGDVPASRVAPSRRSDPAPSDRTGADACVSGPATRQRHDDMAMTCQSRRSTETMHVDRTTQADRAGGFPD